MNTNKYSPFVPDPEHTQQILKTFQTDSNTGKKKTCLILTQASLNIIKLNYVDIVENTMVVIQWCGEHVAKTSVTKGQAERPVCKNKCTVRPDKEACFRSESAVSTGVGCWKQPGIHGRVWQL